jgi:hypothetical protein
MKISSITKTKIAVFTGITGGLIFLLFLFFGFGIPTDDIFILGGLFATILFTSITFVLLNSDWK